MLQQKLSLIHSVNQAMHTPYSQCASMCLNSRPCASVRAHASFSTTVIHNVHFRHSPFQLTEFQFAGFLRLCSLSVQSHAQYRPRCRLRILFFLNSSNFNPKLSLSLTISLDLTLTISLTHSRVPTDS